MTYNVFGGTLSLALSLSMLVITVENRRLRRFGHVQCM